MPILTFSGEKNIDELSDKLFVRLTPRQREKVSDALLKANPQLGELATVAPGTLLDVPDLPELSAKARAVSDSPDQLLLAQLRNELGGYQKRLAARYDDVQAELEGSKRVLADQVLIKVIGEDPMLRAVVDGIGKANEARAGELAQQQKDFSGAMDQMLKDLGSLG
ncbi:MAG: hypothetical protein JWQ69_782 [Pseudomonas sp.]|nr:hypothetical protein [Pseudomonas sp.]